MKGSSYKRKRESGTDTAASSLDAVRELVKESLRRDEYAEKATASLLQEAKGFMAMMMARMSSGAGGVPYTVIDGSAGAGGVPMGVGGVSGRQFVMPAAPAMVPGTWNQAGTQALPFSLSATSTVAGMGGASAASATVGTGGASMAAGGAQGPHMFTIPAPHAMVDSTWSFGPGAQAQPLPSAGATTFSFGGGAAAASAVGADSAASIFDSDEMI